MIFRIGDQSQVGSARRAAATLARECGCVEADAGRVSIVATEMATNLLRHAGSGHAGGGHTSGGEIAMQRIADGEGDWLELVAFDCGPGIADTARAMEDGFSPDSTFGYLRQHPAVPSENQACVRFSRDSISPSFDCLRSNSGVC